MAIKRVTKNVVIDDDAKVIYVDLAKLTEEDKGLIELNKGNGYAFVSMSELSRANRSKAGKKSSRDKKYWLGKLKTQEQKEEFEKLCHTEGKGFFAAREYARKELGLK